MITLFVIIPLASAFIISLVGRFYKYVSDTLANLSCVSLVVLSFVFLFKRSAVNYKPIIHQAGGWILPFGICFVLDGLSIFMVVVINVIAFCACLFSISYMEKYVDKWKYYTLFLLMLAGLNGVVITGDIFNLFVWLEIAAVASYALVSFGTEAEELEAAFKYAVMSSVASLFVLIAIALLYAYTSTLNMADICQMLITKPNPTLIRFITVLFLFGFGLKAAIMPFHSWLPDAHPSAPAPISAMLSGVLIKSSGIYALSRTLFNILGTA